MKFASKCKPAVARAIYEWTAGAHLCSKNEAFFQKNASFSLQSGARLHKRCKSYSGDNCVQAGMRRKSYLLQKEISQVRVAYVKDPWPHFINAKLQTFWD